MKKVILVAAVVMLALVSCKKDHTCSCTVTSNSIFGNFTITTDTLYTIMNKSNAEDLCASNNYNVTSAAASGSAVCNLK